MQLNPYFLQKLLKFNVVFVFLLFFANHTFSQSSIEVHLKVIKSDRNLYLDTFQLFKNNTLLKTVSRPKDQEVIRFLGKGNYRIDYNTIFGKKESVHIEINETKTYKADLVLDYLNYAIETNIPMIDQIKSGEEYLINIISFGCFHQSNDTLIIAKRNGNYFASYKKRQKKLSNEEVKLLREFEHEMHYIGKGGCTTTTDYVIIYQNEQIFHVMDGSCDWDGGYLLLDTFGWIER